MDLSNKWQCRTLLWAMLSVVALCLALLAPRYFDLSLGHSSMLGIHLLMELFAIIIAILIVVTSWHTFESQKGEPTTLLIGGFVVVAACDLLHALSYAGMPALIAPSGTERAIFFWLMGRSVEVAMLGLIALGVAPGLSRRGSLLLGVVASGLLAWFGAYQLELFPRTFVIGQGVTPFKAGYEVTLTVLNVLVAGLFWREARRQDEPQTYLLALSCFVMGIGGVMFTAYVTPSDFQNIFGHVFKIIAYALLYNATFVVRIREPYRRAVEAEKRLTRSEKNLQLFIDYAPAALAMLDRELRYVSVSRRWLEDYGLSGRELRGQRHYEVFPGIPAHWRQAYDDALAGKGSRSQPESLVLPDGSSRWVRWEVLPWPDPEGGVGGIVIFSEDLSAIKKNEDALQESKEEFRVLTDVMPQIVWGAQPDGRCTYLNRQWFDYTGLSPEQSYGDHWISPFHPDDRERAWTAWRHATATDSDYSIECRLRRHDGVYRWWLVRGVSMHDDQGRVTKWFGTCTDIEDMKRAESGRLELEAQLRESQKMEAIGTLAGGIAHDFNNIISIILGNTHLAQQDASANPQMLESLRQIEKAGTRAKNLVKQILSFERRQPTERRRISLTPVVYETSSLLRASLPARVSLDVQCVKEVPEVLADPTQIEQILINLATNAMQAIQGAPGIISIRLDTVLLDEALAGTHPGLAALRSSGIGIMVRLLVRDSGKGMDAATLARIFEPFFTTKPANEGTGLGLSVVQGIVERHEGIITVKSAPGDGATFTIFLPAAGAAADAGSAEAAPELVTQASARELHIAYIDDDESLTYLVKRMLERRGVRVSAHTSADEALRAIGEQPGDFDLVLTDYNMPGASGLDVARAVRAFRGDLPVVVTSGFIDETLRAQAADAGVCEILFKGDIAETLCNDVLRLAQSLSRPQAPH